MLREALADIRTRFAGGEASPVRQVERSKAIGVLRQSACCSVEDLFSEEGSSPSGLSAAVAEERLTRHGLNQVAHERPIAWYVQLWNAFANCLFRPPGGAGDGVRHR